ncbi:hypothetical protein RZO55_06765 [Clostridium boliviensis]|uniref:CBM-cenC domain-containing protein n=1 Tax=Clostridium boliviensis TaxID=318465 RepID=A0ABU4GI31_9CLOT|nr:hypothetical protein [Clostridium boliviensis]MDW2797276.1 hypothetical protein [Clostridium boliviensis]
MFVKLKKSTFIMCLVMSCFLMGKDALASTQYSYVPVNTLGQPSIQWANTSSIDINLSFSGSKAICGACVQGWSDVKNITGTAVLSRKNSNGSYTTVKTWKNLNVAGNRLIFDGRYYVSRGYTYRLTITATVYRNGVGETVSGYFENYAK